MDMAYLDKYVLQEIAFQDTLYALTIEGYFFFESIEEDPQSTLRLFTTKVDATNYKHYLMGKLEARDEPEDIDVVAVSLTKVMNEADYMDEASFKDSGQSLTIMVTSFSDNDEKSRNILQLYPPKEEKDLN